MNLHSPLGSYATHEEFQVERTIVSIRIPEHGSREIWLSTGKALYYDTAKRTPDVLALAAEHTRNLYPSLSANAELYADSTLGLELRGVCIDPSDGTIAYDVFDPSDTFPASNDDLMHADVYSIDVELAANGILQVLTENER